MENTLDRVQELIPLVAKQAEDIERDRGPTPELVAQLRRTGCLRMLAPGDRGGQELAFPDVLTVVQTLATADGSIGWLIGQAAMAQLVLSYFPAATIEKCYSAGPDLVGAGAVAPKGKALPAPGGWRVSGQWPFVSGIDHASWVYLQCAVLGGGDRDGDESAGSEMPELRLMLFPIQEVRRIDTWQVLGLRGTGSHDVRARGFCPDDHSTSLLGGSSTLDRPAYRIPTVEYGGLLVAATAVGIALAALDDVLAGAGRRPAFSLTPLADSPSFRGDLGEAYMTIQGVQALLATQAAGAHRTVSAGIPLSATQRGTLRGTVAITMATARRVVETAYLLGGGPALYERSPLQRRLRDIHAASQHAAAGRHSYALLGEELLGRQPGLLRT